MIFLNHYAVTIYVLNRRVLKDFKGGVFSKTNDVAKVFFEEMKRRFLALPKKPGVQG